FLAYREIVAFVVGDPFGGAPEPQRLIVGFPGEGIDGGNDHLSDVGTLERGARQDESRRPQRVAQFSRRLDVYRSNVDKRDPEISSGGKHFQTVADLRIGVGNGMEWFAVQRAGGRGAAGGLG